MIQFFIVFLQDTTNSENIVFSNFDGSATPVVILDDGWAPNITKYIRDGEKTWDDVVEELECMTNVATRDEALAILEKLNALIHRAARDIEEKQAYTVRFVVRSQFSNAPNSSFTHVISPPDDGIVITLSTDIQAAPPGQIKFKLRFKRTGAWITTFNDNIKNFYLSSFEYGYKGLWVNYTDLLSSVNIPTPISLKFKPVFSNNDGTTVVENMFVCANIDSHVVVKNFTSPPFYDFTEITYPNSMHAQDDKGYLIKSNGAPYSNIPGPFSNINIPNGTYAVFVFWRSVQSNVPHALKLRFNEDTETNYTILLSSDTHPKLSFLGTVVLNKQMTMLYLIPKIGHSTGFEIEKIVFVKLKSTSSIVNVKSFMPFFQILYGYEIFLENNLVKPNKTLGLVYNNQLQKSLHTYDSLDVVSDSQTISLLIVGHSPEIFSITAGYGGYNYHVHSWYTTITYRLIRTTFH